MSDENTLQENEKLTQSGQGCPGTWSYSSANQHSSLASRGADVNRILGEN